MNKQPSWVEQAAKMKQQSIHDILNKINETYMRLKRESQ